MLSLCCLHIVHVRMEHLNNLTRCRHATAAEDEEEAFGDAADDERYREIGEVRSHSPGC